MLTRHIQNPVIRYYSAISTHIQNLVQCLHMQKPGTLGIMEYSKLFHNCIPTHIQNPVIFDENLQIFRTLTYLKLDTYFEPSQTFKIGCFAKIVKKTIIIFPKCSILDL